MGLVVKTAPARFVNRSRMPIHTECAGTLLVCRYTDLPLPHVGLVCLYRGTLIC
jgi:hypothetical protein